VVGRFLQVLGARVDHEPVGLGGANVDWRATFPGGEVIYVEATSPAYSQEAFRERRRREALLGVIEEEMPAGWWVNPKGLPRLGLHDSRREFLGTVRALLASLPDRSLYSIENRLELAAMTKHGPVELELWPGNPTHGPIGMAGMGAYRDDSALRVAVAARAKRHQARAFPGEAVLLAIDAPFEGPDREDFDEALLGQEVVHLGSDFEAVRYSFRANGALATQRAVEYAGVLAFGRVSVFGAGDPVLYRHPQYAGSLPGEVLELRQRFLVDGGIGNVPAARARVADAIGFPTSRDD
jgi:hypothetical protein